MGGEGDGGGFLPGIMEIYFQQLPAKQHFIAILSFFKTHNFWITI
jgi:hypothetical protein